MPKMTKGGRRWGPRNYLLETQARYPDKLFIATDTLVNRILFSDDRRQGLNAVGVECFEKDHIYQACPVRNELSTIERFTKSKTYRARREVIVAAGAFNSPQLLMLSGIGEEAQLRAQGIKTILPLAGVGKNLQDRYEMTVVNDLGDASPLTDGCTFGNAGDPCMRDYQNDPTRALYGSNGLVAGLKVKSHSSLSEPDLMIFGGPTMFTGYFKGYSGKALARPDTFTWAILKGQTKNHAGEVRLKSKDPLARPDINFNYFTNGAREDMSAMLEGLKLTRRIYKRYHQLGLLALDFNPNKELFPGAHLQSDADLDLVTRKESWGHHASCSNKMGRRDDPTTVVDGQFKVHGTKNLRIVDASVFPKIPGLFIAVPTFMMAEKAAQDILRAARN
jgi:choline dehydrogenase